MKPMTQMAAVALGLALGMMTNGTALADTFGSGANTFTIDFVNVGNAGNANDVGPNGGPYGGVAYNFRVGTFEISQDAIARATASGMTHVTAGAWTGSQPAANMTWYEAAGVVNWMNTSTGRQAAYQLNETNTAMTLWSSAQAWQTGGENLYRHKDAFYFLPSENEWYKAAYHQNDGVTANYWNYATGSNGIPTSVASGTGAGTAVFNSVAGSPALVTNNGGLSAYGAMGMSGNVYEWNESASTAPNDSSSEDRAIRGGNWVDTEVNLRSSARVNINPSYENGDIGFRVASVPEPSTAFIILIPMGAWLLRRRWSRSL
jgi:formylglycine-generating enzyme required for sulfatase activity